MGWKGTERISREEAISLIIKRLPNATNRQLADTLETIGYGDTVGIEYFGSNFRVFGEMENEED